ncbi:MAG: hypothetical protein IJM59_05440, partial [Proteobacteria bacterium]|nr:hypothetical protein [Pseudomonadota bacterium]
DEYDPKYTSNGSVSCNADCTVNFDNCQEKQTGDTKAATIRIKDIQQTLTKTNDGTGYSAIYTYAGDGFSINLHGNLAKDNTNNEFVFFMDETSQIEITGLNGLSEIKIKCRSNKDDNGFSITAGSYKQSFDIAKSTSFEYQEIKVTDADANNITINSVKVKALIIDEISWK